MVNGEIAEDLTRYFAESEQIPSACALGVLVDTDRSVKCAGGWMVQLMPGVKDADIDRLEANLAKIEPMTTMLDKGITLEQIVQAVLDGFAVDFLQTDPIGYRCAVQPGEGGARFCSAWEKMNYPKWRKNRKKVRLHANFAIKSTLFRGKSCGSF